MYKIILLIPYHLLYERMPDWLLHTLTITLVWTIFHISSQTGKPLSPLFPQPNPFPVSSVRKNPSTYISSVREKPIPNIYCQDKPKSQYFLLWGKTKVLIFPLSGKSQVPIFPQSEKTDSCCLLSHKKINSPLKTHFLHFYQFLQKMETHPP